MKKENGWVRVGLITLVIAILAGGGWWWYRGTQTDAATSDKSGTSADAKSGASAGAGKGPGGGRGAVPAVIDQVRVSEVPVIVTAIGTVTARAT